jgi:hypothetical protein
MVGLCWGLGWVLTVGCSLMGSSILPAHLLMLCACANFFAASVVCAEKGQGL